MIEGFLYVTSEDIKGRIILLLVYLPDPTFLSVQYYNTLILLTS